MPIGDIVAETLGGVVRMIGRVVVELVFQLLIVGTGHAIIRSVKPTSEPSDTACAGVGVLSWAVVGIGGYFIYRATVT
jgi:hypothetical protein